MYTREQLTTLPFLIVRVVGEAGEGLVSWEQHFCNPLIQCFPNSFDKTPLFPFLPLSVNKTPHPIFLINFCIIFILNYFSKMDFLQFVDDFSTENCKEPKSMQIQISQIMNSLNSNLKDTPNTPSVHKSKTPLEDFETPPWGLNTPFRETLL